MPNVTQLENSWKHRFELGSGWLWGTQALHHGAEAVLPHVCVTRVTCVPCVRIGAHGFTTIYFSFLVLFSQAMAFPPSCPLAPAPGCPPRCERASSVTCARLGSADLAPTWLAHWNSRQGGAGGVRVGGGEEGRDPL